MRLLETLQRWRFGAAGSALAVGVAAFGLGWTVAQAIGLQGGIGVFFILLNISLVLGFGVFHYLRVQHILLTHRSSFYRGEIQPVDPGKLSRMIGIVAPISSWATMFYVDIVRGIREAAEREREDVQRRLLVIDVPREEFDPTAEAAIHRVIHDIDGLISINIKFTDSICQALATAHLPVVNVHHEETGEPFVASLIPDHSAFEELLQHLLIEKECGTAIMLSKGLTNPFKHVKVDPFRKEKWDAFTRLAQTRGLSTKQPRHLIEFKEPVQAGNAYIFELDRYVSAYGEELFERIADTCPRGTAVICLADDVAIGFLVACLRSGRSAQARGFRVSGFDNTQASKWFDLTTIDYELRTVGYLAYSRLQTVLERPGTVSYTTEKVKTTLIRRGSTDW